MKWSSEMTKDWLTSGMFYGEKNAGAMAENILHELADHALTKSHARHLSGQKCKDIGLKIEDLEESQHLQEAVLSLHHACIHTLSSTAAFKFIENHNGTAFIQVAQQVLVQQQQIG